MDYAFAPGSSPYDSMVRDLFGRRSNTTVKTNRQSSPGSTTRLASSRVDHYISGLSNDNDVTRPAGVIFISTHGNDGGWMQIPFADIDADGDGSPDANTTYEVLEVADTSNVCDIPAALRDANTKIRIRGCNIGQDFALPYIQKLRAAFGGNVPVSAPKHFHFVYSFSTAGFLELFAYELSITSKTRITTRQALKQKFVTKNPKFKFLDNTDIADTWFEKWLPGHIGLGMQTVRHRVTFDPPIHPSQGSDISTHRISVNRGFRARRTRPFTWTLTNVTSDPGSAAARKTMIHNSILGSPEFQSEPTNPYPYHKRSEFQTAQEFLDETNWRVTYNSSQKTLVGVGTRFIYTLVVPIVNVPHLTDNTKNKLIFNFYPNSNNNTPEIVLINETDTSLFQIV